MTTFADIFEPDHIPRLDISRLERTVLEAKTALRDLKRLHMEPGQGIPQTPLWQGYFHLARLMDSTLYLVQGFSKLEMNVLVAEASREDWRAGQLLPPCKDRSLKRRLEGQPALINHMGYFLDSLYKIGEGMVNFTVEYTTGRPPDSRMRTHEKIDMIPQHSIRKATRQGNTRRATYERFTRLRNGFTHNHVHVHMHYEPTGEKRSLWKGQRGRQLMLDISTANNGRSIHVEAEFSSLITTLAAHFAEYVRDVAVEIQRYEMQQQTTPSHR